MKQAAGGTIGVDDDVVAIDGQQGRGRIGHGIAEEISAHHRIGPSIALVIHCAYVPRSKPLVE